MGFLSGEKTIEQLEEDKQAYAARLDIEQKKALIAEAKRRYGKDWTKMFSNMGGGMDWQKLKFQIGTATKNVSNRR